jgi:hypothetical protein
VVNIELVDGLFESESTNAKKIEQLTRINTQNEKKLFYKIQRSGFGLTIVLKTVR